MMGYLILFGGVWLAAMLGLKVGELVGKLTDSTVVASLITGRGELHGFDTSAIVFLIGGGLGGIVAGTKLGNSFARRL